MTKERRIEIELDGYKLISDAHKKLLKAQMNPDNLVDGELRIAQAVINTTTIIADELMKQAELLVSLLKEKDNG